MRGGWNIGFFGVALAFLYGAGLVAWSVVRDVWRLIFGR